MCLSSQPFEVHCTNTIVHSATAHSSSLRPKIAGVCTAIDRGYSERCNARSGDNDSSVLGRTVVKTMREDCR